jgi:hypothetical protein
MNTKSWLLIAAAVLLATGCTTVQEPASKSTVPVAKPRSFDISPEGFNPAVVMRPERYKVNVFVDEGQLLVIDQEPVRAKPGDTEIVIQWKLAEDTPLNPSPYVFRDNNAIQMELKEGTGPIPDCARVSDKKFVCSYTRQGPAKWKYSIRVTNRQSGIDLYPPLDPWVHQP